jgi:hypothetical protein
MGERLRLSGSSASLLLTTLLAVGCVTPVSEADLEKQLAEAAAPVTGRSETRVLPVTAETRFVAWALLTEAKGDHSSPLSVQLSRRIALAARRHMKVVVGGPYAGLTDQVLRNALSLQEERAVRGMTLVLVSEEPPSPELAQAAQAAQARLYHRRLR